MIVIRLQGGLGNQMFQYAYGRELIARGRPVVFEDGSFEGDPLRSYELDVWLTSVPLLPAATRPLIPRCFGGDGWRNRLRGKRPLRQIIEDPLGFQPGLLSPPDHSYLDGYWQSEKFFASVRDEIVSAFQPAKRLSAESIAVAWRIQNAVDSVAVHVRRTDYLKLAFMQVVDVGYYQRCVGELVARHAGIEAFVFSDDLAWCEKNLRLPCPTHFVGHNHGATAYEDLWLMSHCRRHVIPNSSFSWWAAWLKKDQAGEVYAPRPWFNDPRMNSPDILPDRWIATPGVAAEPIRRAA